MLASAFDRWPRAREPRRRLSLRDHATNLTTGERFAFERDVVGDYVLGLAPTAGTGVRVATAVAASACVPGALPPRGHPRRPFSLPEWETPVLVDGGAYDNTGLEAFDGERYRDVFLITINARGVFVTGSIRRASRRAAPRPLQLAALPPEHRVADALDGRALPGL